MKQTMRTPEAFPVTIYYRKSKHCHWWQIGNVRSYDDLVRQVSAALRDAPNYLYAYLPGVCDGMEDGTPDDVKDNPNMRPLFVE